MLCMCSPTYFKTTILKYAYNAQLLCLSKSFQFHFDHIYNHFACNVRSLQHTVHFNIFRYNQSRNSVQLFKYRNQPFKLHTINSDNVHVNPTSYSTLHYLFTISIQLKFSHNHVFQCYLFSTCVFTSACFNYNCGDFTSMLSIASN